MELGLPGSSGDNSLGTSPTQAFLDLETEAPTQGNQFQGEGSMEGVAVEPGVGSGRPSGGCERPTDGGRRPRNAPGTIGGGKGRESRPALP
eukprot:1562873-Heterocapsa_arctica.AAC.1